MVIKKHFKSGFSSNFQIINKLSNFQPVSGNHWLNPDLTYDSANNFPKQLIKLQATLDELFEFQPIVKEFKVKDISDFKENPNISTKFVSKVFEDFNCSKVQFSPAYSYLLGEISKLPNPRILEIGLGTNNKNMISGMTRSYVPGASLRSYKKILASANCFGADIDSSILFSDDGIVTAWANQTDLNSMLNLPKKFSEKEFDLVIDDGLHSTEANLNTLIFALKHTSIHSFIYIEDISKNSISVWEIISIFLNNYGFLVEIFNQDSDGLSVLIQREKIL